MYLPHPSIHLIALVVCLRKVDAPLFFTRVRDCYKFANWPFPAEHTVAAVATAPFMSTPPARSAASNVATPSRGLVEHMIGPGGFPSLTPSLFPLSGLQRQHHATSPPAVQPPIGSPASAASPLSALAPHRASPTQPPIGSPASFASPLSAVAPRHASPTQLPSASQFGGHANMVTGEAQRSQAMHTDDYEEVEGEVISFRPASTTPTRWPGSGSCSHVCTVGRENKVTSLPSPPPPPQNKQTDRQTNKQQSFTQTPTPVSTPSDVRLSPSP